MNQPKENYDSVAGTLGIDLDSDIPRQTYDRKDDKLYYHPFSNLGRDPMNLDGVPSPASSLDTAERERRRIDACLKGCREEGILPTSSDLEKKGEPLTEGEKGASFVLRGDRRIRINRIKSVVPLLTKAIKTIDLNKSEYKARIRNSPGVRLPNISNFNIILGGPNLLFRYFGITKKMPPILQLTANENRSMNRFIEHQVIRLEKYRNAGNNQAYWTLALAIMKRSNIFRVAAIRHVIPRGHRNNTLGSIINYNRKVSKLINEGQSKLDFSRVYIEKGETGRPLGVPTVPGRIYLHMMSNFLTFYLQPKLHPNQHAFLPGKGTLTAGKQIFEKKLYLKPYIMEWDFKQFFPTIHSNRITAELLRYGVPKKVAYFLENVNRSEVKFDTESGKKRLLDESIADRMKRSHEVHMHGRGHPHDAMFDGVREMLYPKPGEFCIDAGFTLNELMREDGCLDIFEFVQLQGALLDHHQPAKIADDFVGVAQGAPTSPILANTIMDIGLKQQNHEETTVCIAYADDSVTFSDYPIKLTAYENKAPSDTGITIHDKKSQIVKRNGVGYGALKFLGLKFDGKIFQGATRKGSELKFNREIEKLLALEQTRIEQGLEISDEESLLKFIKDSNEKVQSGSASMMSNGEKVFKNRLIGFVQSRLYQGEGNLENLEQDFDYKFIHNSGADRDSKKVYPSSRPEMTIFNSSSFACKNLASIFRFNSKPKGLTGKLGGLPRNIIFKLVKGPQV